MEGNTANTSDPAPNNAQPPPPPKNREQLPYEIEFGKLKIKGPQSFISALVIGLIAGGMLFYLLVFQFKKPPIFYRILVEEPYFQTRTAAPSITPNPPQIMEVTREVTRLVPTVYVTRETVHVPTLVIAKETVVVKETVFVPTVVVVTATPTPPPGVSEILDSGLQAAFECGALVLRNLGGIDFQGWSQEKIQNKIMQQWLNTNCGVIWGSFAQDRMVQELVYLLRQFKNVTRVEWEAEILPGYSPPQTNNRYDLSGFITRLQISGEYICPSTDQLTAIAGDENPLEYESARMTVEVQMLNNRAVVFEWRPSRSSLELLDQRCQ